MSKRRIELERLNSGFKYNGKDLGCEYGSEEEEVGKRDAVESVSQCQSG